MLDRQAVEAASVRIEARLRASHDRLYPGCRGWRSSAEAIVIDHGAVGVWRWHGCPDHAPSTTSGMASERMVAQARVALRAI